MLVSDSCLSYRQLPDMREHVQIRNIQHNYVDHSTYSLQDSLGITDSCVLRVEEPSEGSN